MVMVLPAKEAVTPAGNPVAVPIPVAPVVVWVMEGVRAILIQTVEVAGDCALTVLAGFTLIVPMAFTVPHPPVNGIVYGNVPETVGVPLMVILFPAHEAVTPVGNPVGVPMPVAPVVVWVDVRGVLTHTVCASSGGLAVLEVMTVIVPVAFIVPQPPVNGMI